MIETGIVLAAGEGSRLRSVAPLKPLCRVDGRTLLAHAVFGMAEAGLARTVVVVGYEAERIESYVAANDWPIIVETIRVEDHRNPNGSSLLAAEPLLGGDEAILAMCDHLVEPTFYRRMAGANTGGGASLGIDRRIDSDWIDLEDVTCVQTDGDCVVGIGKGLAVYDCFDTGVFTVGKGLFDALRGLEKPSLTEGMRRLASDRAAAVKDCSDLEWIDVDDERAWHIAETWLAAGRRSADIGEMATRTMLPT
ncbi:MULTISPECIES: phosphocholine cytidylyltransferase family protein [Sphingomonas]|jgi:1L-myo-inositol 1-phosphate cytidylyltransferase|uniref:NTP transferase domain-containing protein n=1 Tax=Sphingomonas zeae TaxID=1646122 RepID=A0A7Y6B8I9_9SPHN|nr:MULTISPECIES: NTP transferase domain-containing protein [Sphingomonas]MBB4047324.1 1L-myo-inositol 1-phosphate cytidylyltransferase [Sphingomonas zeae]MDK8185317.1 NTP transferase domain-containing protein [Sphingomonas zeae]MDK8214741.1 NTP transferase domain-containing protein [Sphingomonas sp. UMB7805-LC452B]NUU48467.1 NTP transferase domain-containing protein [Sphingomonas zeae]